jgi:hypothetical protein
LYPIDTGRLESTNNRIKVIKRVAYGFHDSEYFALKVEQAFLGLQLNWRRTGNPNARKRQR